jgi:iron-sulfur cluster repair protein YtfE (RIC family)
MTYTPSTALRELLAQHAKLRDMMERCEQLADELERSGGDPSPLTREVARIRLAFDAHNTYEEQLLRPVLEAADSFGAVRIDRMVAEHVDEHRSMRTRLAGWTATSALREVLDNLRAHLDAEERYFLSAKFLRDDVVSVEGGG